MKRLSDRTTFCELGSTTYKLPADHPTCDVSVVIPTFNRPSFLHRALSSVLAQTAIPTQVIVIDDCSGDMETLATESVIEKFSESLNLFLIRNDANRGANYSRNRGIDAATGQYIAFLDSDDFWMPDKLARQIELIEQSAKRDDAILCVTGRYRVSSDTGKIISRQLVRSSFSSDAIIRSNFIGTLSSVLVTTSVARAVRGFDETLPACQDWEFFIRIAKNVKFLSVRAPLCVYVEHHEDRISASNRKRLQGHFLIRRKYLKQSEVDLSNFYRNVGEELQLLGKERLATEYYIQAVTQYVLPVWKRALLQMSLRAYYTWRRPPRLKANRYLSYKKALTKFARSADGRSQLQRDHDFIKTALQQW